MSDKVTLLDFAASANTRQRKCATCNLPSDVLAEVNAGLREGLGHKVIGEWLKDVKGINAKPTGYHFQAKHHLEDA
jgi:hypothetical protein